MTSACAVGEKERCAVAARTAGAESDGVDVFLRHAAQSDHFAVERDEICHEFAAGLGRKALCGEGFGK